MPPTFFYLHGFASGPSSSKGVFLKQQLAQSDNIDLQIPDFNEGGFTHLTVSRQIEQVCDRLPNSPTILIGSSLGGLTAAWVAEQMPQVERVILLAPAFEFARRWQMALGREAIAAWQAHGKRSFFHYGQQAELPLHYRFVEDALGYNEAQLKRQVPTAIVHGRQDDVVPVRVSRQFAGDRDWVELLELDSDHALGDEASKAAIWKTVQRFCGLA
ncbi:YqiA/YcfP family alpha/beta fold hydrolase [Synechococcus sp. PCC 7336]|uniref:YqiA/YcfP family alpha/beta fold hydrolase n=1 Tax=Synechococcus sp. PCC 7336 TaxID=195250 RepID=UPI00037F343C|nr:YqiA/YcfP family alpha/beta fold hydrolase [Synechococcus sp. PCC 7336]